MRIKKRLIKKNDLVVFFGISLCSLLFVLALFFFSGFFFLLLFRLKRIDDLLSSACQSAEAIYMVLFWDNHTKSSRSASTLMHSHGMLAKQT